MSRSSRPPIMLNALPRSAMFEVSRSSPSTGFILRDRHTWWWFHGWNMMIMAIDLWCHTMTECRIRTLCFQDSLDHLLRNSWRVWFTCRNLFGNISRAPEGRCGVLYSCTIKEVIQDQKLDCNFFSPLLLCWITVLPHSYKSWFSIKLHTHEYYGIEKKKIQICTCTHIGIGFVHAHYKTRKLRHFEFVFFVIFKWWKDLSCNEIFLMVLIPNSQFASSGLFSIYFFGIEMVWSWFLILATVMQVALKTLIVIHRTLREGDPTFREELLNYSNRGRILQISYFKDDSSPLGKHCCTSSRYHQSGVTEKRKSSVIHFLLDVAWDCSAWVRTYALFLEERLECFRVLKFDVETERLTKSSPGGSKVCLEIIASNINNL